MQDNYANDPVWAKRAKAIVRAEMVRRDLTYQDLEQLLRRMGVEKTAGNLATRISSGAFGVQLFLQVMLAMGVRQIDISHLISQENRADAPVLL
ncbi:MAG: DUF6471 domain-containing protein [Nevskiales bacterium]